MVKFKPSDGDPSFVSILTTCCLITFFCYFAASMRLPVVPLHASGYGVTTAQIGVINAAFYLAAGFLSLPSGALSDFFGRRNLAVIGSFILCAGMLLLCLGESYGAFVGIYLLLGAGIAAFGPTLMSWVAEISPVTHLGRSYGWYTTALFCGMGMGPAVGGAVGRFLGIRAVFLIGAVVLGVNIFVIGKTLAFTKRKPVSKTDWRIWRTDIKAVLTNRPLVGCWVAVFGSCGISGMFFSFLPLHGHNQGLGVGQIGVVYLVQSAANALSRIPFGAFSDRVGRRKLQALAGITLISLSIAGFALAESFSQFIIFGLCLGVSSGIAFTSIGALIAETVADRFRGLAMGGYNAAIYFGLMTGSITLGPVIEDVGFAWGFFFTGAVNVPLILFYIWSMRGYSRKASENV